MISLLAATRSPRSGARFAFALFIAAMPACGTHTATTKGTSPNEKVKVAFVSNNPASFWTIAEAGCKKGAADFNCEVLFRKPETGDPAKQQEVIDGLVNQNVRAIAVSVIDPVNQKTYLNKVAAKAPLITVDNDCPNSRRSCYIGTNNYTAGRALGKLVKEAKPKGGTLAIFVGQLDALNARQRRQGLLDELADKLAPSDVTAFTPSADGQKYGQFKLMKTYTDQPIGESKAKENASDALLQMKDDPDVVMVGLWAYNPPAILAAVKEQKKLGQVTILGFDEDFGTLQGIVDGHIFATVVQDPFNFGYESVRMMADLARGIPAKERDDLKFIPHRVVVKDAAGDRLGAAAFTAELRKLLGQ